MGRQHVADGRIAVTQVKTGTRLLLPILPDLVAAIEAMPADNMTFLVTSFGKPFTTNGFGNWFRDQCNVAGLPSCTAHGLRKTALRRMAEAGFTQQEIKAWSGHRGHAEVALYTRDPNQAGIAQGAAPKLEIANRAAKLDKNPPNSIKRGA